MGGGAGEGVKRTRPRRHVPCRCRDDPVTVPCELKSSLWVSLWVLAGLVVAIVVLSQGADTSRSHSKGVGDRGPNVQDDAADPGQTRPPEAGEKGGAQQEGRLWSALHELEREESAELAPLLAERVGRLERLRDAGQVGAETVLLARIEEALGRIACAPVSERWQLLRSTDDWARTLRDLAELLFEAGRLSSGERDAAARALEALRTGEAWLLSPRRQLAKEAQDPPAAPVSPAKEDERVAEVRARHLKRQVEALAGAAEPDFAILRLLLQARLGDTSFEAARAEAQRQLDRVPLASRAEAEALAALFDWYGWARLRELDAEQK